jgi:hypothetical protein
MRTLSSAFLSKIILANVGLYVANQGNYNMKFTEKRGVLVHEKKL